LTGRPSSSYARRRPAPRAGLMALPAPVGLVSSHASLPNGLTAATRLGRVPVTPCRRRLKFSHCFRQLPVSSLGPMMALLLQEALTPPQA
jgi:hypothetical protein